MELPPGHIVGNYEVEALLGRGGFEVVYRVRHSDLGTRHALVTLSHPALRAHLILAGQIQATLRHPNLVNATDVVRVEGEPALVLDYVQGPTLGEHVGMHGPLSVADADGLVAGIVAGLDHVHRHGVVHRDVTPNEVLLRQDRGELVPVLTGFALAVRQGANRPVPTGRVYGTPWYMPPEQAIDTDLVDERADVFGAAATMFFALTGMPPIEGEDSDTAVRAARRGEHRVVESIRPDLPDRIVAAVGRGMAPDRAQRFPDVRALLATWTAGGATGGFRIPPAPTGEVTLVFTDVQGSTSMWERTPEAMRRVLAAHDAVMRSALFRLGGHEVKTQGDSFMVAFSDPVRAVRWCVEVQVALDQHPWPPEIATTDGAASVLVRMGLHVGHPDCSPHPVTGAVDYFGPAVNNAARIQGAAHGGQILASRALGDRVGQIAGVRVRPLGTFSLKGIARPTEILELVPDVLSKRSFPRPNAEPSG